MTCNSVQRVGLPASRGAGAAVWKGQYREAVLEAGISRPAIQKGPRGLFYDGGQRASGAAGNDGDWAGEIGERWPTCRDQMPRRLNQA